MGCGSAIVDLLVLNVEVGRSLCCCAPTLVLTIVGLIGLGDGARVFCSFVVSGQSWGSVMVTCLLAAYVERTGGYGVCYSTFCTGFWLFVVTYYLQIAHKLVSSSLLLHLSINTTVHCQVHPCQGWKGAVFHIKACKKTSAFIELSL